MTFPSYLRPDLLNPPVWYDTAIEPPPVGIWVMVRRNADEPPDIDRVTVIERDATDGDGRVRTERVKMWCRDDRGWGCFAPVPLDFWTYWASAVMEESE